MKKIRYISLYLCARNHYNQGMEKVGTIVHLDPFTLVGKTFKKDLIGDNYISEGWSEIERSLPLLMEACEKGNFTPSLYGIAFDDNTYFAGLKTPADADIPADLKTPADTDILAASAFCFATAGSDTIALGKRLLNEQADLLLFAGGDGTARDIYQAVGTELVCVGIPAGVKIHSPVYAKNPGAAGKLAAMWMSGRIKRYEEKEVLDIDEDAYRSGHINTALYGYLKIPAERALTQNRKAPTPLSDEAAIESIAYEVTDHMEPGVVYLVGAGTTTRGVMKKLGLPNTLIGVDVVENGKVLENDAYGERILSHIRGKRAKLILTVTGGQGFLFGRGNQQLTPEVIRTVGKENLIILATSSKLAELRGNPLLVDTGDDALNEELCGYYRVITGYKEYTVCRVAAG